MKVRVTLVLIVCILIVGAIFVNIKNNTSSIFVTIKNENSSDEYRIVPNNYGNLSKEQQEKILEEQLLRKTEEVINTFDGVIRSDVVINTDNSVTVTLSLDANSQSFIGEDKIKEYIHKCILIDKEAVSEENVLIVIEE